MFYMLDIKILRLLLFLSLCHLCLFTSTHKHTGGEYVKNGQNFPLVGTNSRVVCTGSQPTSERTICSLGTSEDRGAVRQTEGRSPPLDPLTAFRMNAPLSSLDPFTVSPINTQ